MPDKERSIPASPANIATLAELGSRVRAFPAAHTSAAEAARAREAVLTKPAGALGRLEELAIWLAAWQGRHPPSLERPLCLVFAGNHGVKCQ